MITKIIGEMISKVAYETGRAPGKILCGRNAYRTLLYEGGDDIRLELSIDGKGQAVFMGIPVEMASPYLSDDMVEVLPDDACAAYKTYFRGGTAGTPEWATTSTAVWEPFSVANGNLLELLYKEDSLPEVNEEEFLEMLEGGNT